MGLTEKEVEVLRLKRKGFTQIQIAKRLKISQPAVSFFYRNAINKVRDSYKTVKLAKRLGVKDE